MNQMPTIDAAFWYIGAAVCIFGLCLIALDISMRIFEWAIDTFDPEPDEHEDINNAKG